ncbi:MAG: DUF433 domain-containing protein, partial [Hyphomonadaceae bacterium]
GSPTSRVLLFCSNNYPKHDDLRLLRASCAKSQILCYTIVTMPPLPGHPRISKDPELVTGLPRITGTRIGVDLIKRNVQAGMSKDLILKVYPNLTK